MDQKFIKATQRKYEERQAYPLEIWFPYMMRRKSGSQAKHQKSEPSKGTLGPNPTIGLNSWYESLVPEVKFAASGQ